jgi:hypothetical protein
VFVLILAGRQLCGVAALLLVPLAKTWVRDASCKHAAAFVQRWVTRRWARTSVLNLYISQLLHRRQSRTSGRFLIRLGYSQGVGCGLSVTKTDRRWEYAGTPKVRSTMRSIDELSHLCIDDWRSSPCTMKCFMFNTRRSHQSKRQ